MKFPALINIFLLTIILVACDSGHNAQASNTQGSKRSQHKVKKNRVKKVVSPVIDYDSISGSLPQGFVYVKNVIPDVIEDLRYNITSNFMGERADGYQANRAILTTEAAQALKGAANQLRDMGYVIKIFDAYRPQSAVNHFLRWSKNNDERNKAYYYPTMSKRRLFGRYISRKSGHTRGSTIDMTICYASTGKEVDMGGHFDFLGQASHTAFVGRYSLGEVTTVHRQNRLMLKGVMTRHGFKAISNEWWHFTLKREPHPTTYYNFPVK